MSFFCAPMFAVVRGVSITSNVNKESIAESSKGSVEIDATQLPNVNFLLRARDRGRHRNDQ